MVALIRELKNEGKIKLGDPKSGFGRLGERATRLCVFFFFYCFILYLYSCLGPGGHAIYRQNARGLEMQESHSDVREGVDGRTYGRFCQNQHFLDAYR